MWHNIEDDILSYIDRKELPMHIANLCIRCGKDRIITKEWEETTESGLKMKKSNAICPDKTCQEEVEKLIADQRNERAKKEAQRMQRLAKIHGASLDSVLTV